MSELGFVIPQVLLVELEYQSFKLKNRDASKMLSLLHEKMRSNRTMFIREKSWKDVNFHNFVTCEMDDFYLITALSAKMTGKDIYVLTDDILMRCQLSVNGINLLSIADLYDESKILASYSTSHISKQHKRIILHEDMEMRVKKLTIAINECENSIKRDIIIISHQLRSSLS